MTTRNDNRLLLAYSGGLDTSVILRWLVDAGYEVIAFTADVGLREDLIGIDEKAYQSGASGFVLSDLREAFVRDFVFPAMGFNARYEDRYLLGTSLARPCIAEEMVRVAHETGCGGIAHGATGKGNDQVRFELACMTLDPTLKIVAPWRDRAFTDLIKGRKEAMDYAAEKGIPIKAKPEAPWSSDENLLHISFEAGVLEDPVARPPKEMFELSCDPRDAPDNPETLQLSFAAGLPVAINGERLGPAEMLTRLNEIGGRHGVGRIDIVESRFVGMKSRGVYETPGGTLLWVAHRDLETLTLDRDVIELKDTLMPRFSRRVYEGLWFSPELDALKAFLKETQQYVTGEVFLELYKGNATVIGRTSPVSLYDHQVASMEDDQGAYEPSDATGFIRLHGLPMVQHRRRLAGGNKDA